MREGATGERARTSPLRALAELRFRLTLRRLKGRGGVPEVVARTVMLFLALPTGLLFSVMAGLAAFRAVRSGASITTTVAASSLFFGIWQTWTVVALSLSDRESFDLRRLLVYPVPPGEAYAYELVASYVGDPFALFWSLILVGAFSGAVAARPGAWAFLLALDHLLFVASVVTFVALLGEVFARALRAKRAKELLVAATYLALLAVFLWGSSGGPSAMWQGMNALRRVRWVAYPAALAAQAGGELYLGHPLRALPWLGLLAVSAAVAGYFAYRLALADALAGGEAASPVGVPLSRPSRLPSILGPLFEKELKYLVRHPLAAVLGLVVPSIALVVGWRVTPYIPRDSGEVVRALPLFGFALYSLLVTQAFWLNTFGTDRGGVRTWFLSPVSLVDVLRAKNTCVRLFSLAIFCVSALALVASAGPPPLWAALSALALHLGIGSYYLAAGNVVSILNARPAAQSLKRGGSLAPFSALLGMGIVSLGAGLFAIPVLISLRLEEPWVLFFGFAALGIAGAVLARSLLPATARLLLRHKEAFLAAVTGDDV